MTSDGGGDDEFRQVNHVKDELRIREVDENVKNGGDVGVVRWERFLHVRSIKVMLVENDDCTRHIVTALLRNCNYEVIEAANGFQAWKILEDLSNHIDIVLTEVVMPSVLGIGLLCKIMSHKTRKNIPVIMMSSHDSMGLVFKCLSKGAVDFLLKPIRKNELINLWQHVWRRCHSSSGSGSGSESGTHAQKSVNSKSCLRLDDSISIIGDDIGSTGDGSDTGSGTQSSWTKQAVELESPQAASPCDQITKHPDSTCGLVIPSAQTPETRDFHDLEGQPDDVGRGGLEDSNIQTEFPVKVPNVNNRIQAVDLRLKVKGDDVDMRGPNPVNQEFEVIKEPKKTLDANMKIIDNSNGVISSKISGVKDDGREVQNRRSILRHSELSAFTRDNTTSNAIKTRITASSSRLDNRSEIMKKDPTRDAHSDGYLIDRSSNEQAVPRKSEPQVHHIHHHHHIHHYHKIEPEPPRSNHKDSGPNQLGAGGSSNGSGEAGSKHGNNGQNGSSSAVNLEGTNVESGGGLAGTNGGSGSENRIDQHKSAHREAALMKFREKRKDRCFQKKVRYQNRKRLAEQRPRVRGQFVKQTGRENSSNTADG